ncbi:MAG: phage tail assembly chaperone [Pseudomonadota bacterium]|nr:phage tail assembly chaperone [Pseudomonadota bacterium]
MLGAAARLGWAPSEFWRATFYELTAALSARFGDDAPQGMDADRLDELMSLYPD